MRGAKFKIENMFWAFLVFWDAAWSNKEQRGSEGEKRIAWFKMFGEIDVEKAF